jgi:hypothetical protein
MAKQGFAKVQAGIEAEGKTPEQAAGIAAAIGRRKYGKAGMAKMAAEGRKRASAKKG